MFQIFVINLERCENKRLKMRSKLEERDYEVVRAVDGRELDEHILSKMGAGVVREWKDPFFDRNMTWGEVGCALSHMKVYEMCVERGVDVAVVLEDDSSVPSDLTDRVERCLAELPSTWELCYLGRKAMDANDLDFSATLLRPGYSYWACAYMIATSGMRKLLSMKRSLVPIDEMIPIAARTSPHEQYNGIFVDEPLATFSLRDLICYPEIEGPSETENTGVLEHCSGDLLVLATGTEMNDGLSRLVKSCRVYGLHLEVMGLGKDWTGGDMANGPGGGLKVNLLREKLRNVPPERVVLVTDGYDVVFSSNAEEILCKYRQFGCDIVFASESSCWPDPGLSGAYPKVEGRRNVYLNSGGMIGTAGALAKIVTTVRDDCDDQLWYTRCFLGRDSQMPSMALDYECSIFQCLNDAEEELGVDLHRSRVVNRRTGTMPCHIHGNGGPSRKVLLNRWGSYLMNDWTATYGYNSRNILQVSDLGPSVKVSVYVYHGRTERAERWLQACFDFVRRSNIDLSVVMLTGPLEDCLRTNSDYLWVIDTHFVVQNEQTLLHLILQNKGIVSPMMCKRDSFWSTFWGSVTQSGWYERSDDYFELCRRERIGCWNVAHLVGNILIRKDYMARVSFSCGPDGFDECMTMSHGCRRDGVFMYCDNQLEFGYISESEDDVPVDAVHPELYDFSHDTEEWGRRYLHPEFLSALHDPSDLAVSEPCEWCFQFPLFNERFCKELIDEVERRSVWSCGGEESVRDERINNVEPVPTVDTHVDQIGFRGQWEKIIGAYVSKLVSHLYSQYSTKGINIAFVVKYEVGGQKALKPHHDASAYSINVALNSEGDDYEGGGTRFIKQDVVVKSKVGHAILHPGRMTHYHEGLPVTKGKRYIFVSFVN